MTEVLRRPVEYTQYASKDFRDVLTEYGITASMSRRANCWDSACSETLFGSLKVERLHGQRLKTRRQSMDEVVAWMLWYHRTRQHSTSAYVSPMRFEENWLANQPRQASARDRLWGTESRGKVTFVIGPAPCAVLICTPAS